IVTKKKENFNKKQCLTLALDKNFRVVQEPLL
ncbi:MAG: hypothetical protein QG657_5090, partial [Acidobacteriota bacterium]|nr:hypothetical protein [Acidobacteriota bacterium]